MFFIQAITHQTGFFSLKTQKFCMFFLQAITHQTGFCFSNFHLRKTACIYTVYHTKNYMLSTKNKHGNWIFFFFSDFQLRKQHAFLPFIKAKIVRYQPRISIQTEIFFPDFQLRKPSCISTKTCMLSTKNKHANWILFFQISSL